MVLRRILSQYGLRRPYSFRYALPVTLNFIIFLIALFLLFYWVIFQKLNFGTVRFYFILYLFCMSIFGVAIAIRHTKFSLILFTWMLLDIAIAFFTYYGSLFGITPNLMPADVNSSSRFDYHSLLQGVPKKEFVQKQKIEIRHNSHGMRGGEVVQRASVIHAYGGSSTYDVANGEGHTWTDRLQANLGDEFSVLNFGVPGYTSVEHVIQTIFYGDVARRYPNCAVYYMGWNDIRNSYIPRLDFAYADFHLPSQIDGLQIRSSPLVNFSPLVRIIYRKIKSLTDTIPMVGASRGENASGGIDETVQFIFERNIEVLSNINRVRGVKTVFIGQLLNKWALTADRPYGWLPNVHDRDLWPMQIQLNQVLKTKAQEFGDLYIDVDIDSFDQRDFHDQGHFSAVGSQKFADVISPALNKYCP
jgi:energy-coupling factor transporter transmembrane protein EcfT